MTISKRKQEMRSDWCGEFFRGLALDFWRAAMDAEITAAEVAFLQEHLRLTAGAHILDVACGEGRLAAPLAAGGYKVTGIDQSAAAIELANNSRADDLNRAGLRFVVQDSRKLAWQAEFDAAFCFGNSFGYFDRADSLKFFATVANALKPGAVFILDTSLAAETFFVVGGAREWSAAGGIHMLMDSQFDCLHGRLHSTFTFLADGKQEIKETCHWIFTVSDICSMLEQSGFTIAALHGSLTGQPFELGAERLLLVANKR